VVTTTQDSVLDAAGRCFSRFGYKKTSMDDVASEARVAKGTVYLYCDSKQDLFYRAVEREMRAWKEGLASLIDPDVPANEILSEMGRRDAAFIEERPLVADLLSGMIDDQLPQYRSEFTKLRSVGLDHVVEVLELGVRQEVFAPDLDVGATARVLQEMQLVGALLSHRSNLSMRDVRRQQAAALHLALLGLERR
jgi:TetR/AcrR family transcriptional regulator, fatty acid metabolism regulator protein